VSPCAVADGHGLLLAAGAAGGTRLRGALAQVLGGIVDEGLDPQTAVDRPRLHPVDDVVHVEPGFTDETLAALAGAGADVRLWPAPHHYFGGVSVVSRRGAAADPRRSGAVRMPA
jgi:gamma-glutamyltranspeptidase / glutathione hydrolase